jgi:hypothetical protein
MMQRHIAVLMQTEDDKEAAHILHVAADRLLAIGSDAAGEKLLDADGEVCGEIKILFVGTA